jgi:hypothetical protein
MRKARKMNAGVNPALTMGGGAIRGHRPLTEK